MAVNFQEIARQRAGTVGSVTIPAPVGGLNSRDSLANMAPTDAIKLENWFADMTEVVLRKGSTSFATNVGTASSDVETLAEYHVGTSRKFIAAANNNIYDVTAGGSSHTSLGSGFTNDRWQWAISAGVMGLVNGADAPRKYDGSSVSSMTISGSGLTATNLNGINVFKQRTFFWTGDDQSFWYSSAVSVMGGTVREFDLGEFGKFGGNLISMVTWNRDSGDGLDDYAAFLMTSGEILIFQGTNPGDASAWAAVGVYKFGNPVADRAVIKHLADPVFITRSGYSPLSFALMDDEQQRQSPWTKIQKDIVTDVANGVSLFGWQAVEYPDGHMIIFNVPLTSTTWKQHVINTITKAWSVFTGWNAPCFGIYNNNLYFGTTTGSIMQGWTGNNDNGSDIAAQARQAFWDLGAPGISKKITMVEPQFGSNGDMTFGVRVDADYIEGPLPQNQYTLGVQQQPWENQAEEWEDDTTLWDKGDGIVRPRLPVGRHGHAFSTNVKLNGQQTVTWARTRLFVNPGGSF